MASALFGRNSVVYELSTVEMPTVYPKIFLINQAGISIYIFANIFRASALFNFKIMDRISRS